MSESVREVGAVNTVTNVDGKWIGDNTDVHGVLRALASGGFDPAGKTIVILGRGGGAKAANAALKKIAREVILLSRQEVPNAGQHPCDLLINATPIGMSPKADASPVEGPLPAREAVFDMVYSPLNTKLLQAAAAEGKIAIGGMKMLVSQAAKQFEIWTRHTAPREVFDIESKP
jgi:shikimate dehydrogenase